MWKLLIADDEPKIRRGLAKVLPWEEMGITVVGEAENGLQALEMAARLKPDILFIDICMPHMDGLEMLEQLGRKIERSEVIVISGHDEFRYAQQAVQLKVFEYLLKPVMKSKLENVVIRAVRKLEETRQSEEALRAISKQLENNSAVIRDNFLVKWMDGLTNGEETEWNLNFSGLAWNHQVSMTVLKALQKVDFGRTVWDKKLLEFAVQNIAGDIVEENQLHAVVFDDRRGHTVILGEPVRPSQWEQMNIKIRDKAEALLKKTIFLETGETAEGSRGAPALYHKLTKDIEDKGGLSPIVILAMKHIERHYHLPSLTLGDVADGVQVSSTYLSKQLKRELGSSFIDHLTEVRIKRAIQLMCDPHVKVYEIAGQVGYSSQHYFSSAFKKITGSSPMLYKRGIRS
jgi:two-component system, response regulator YesN